MKAKIVLEDGKSFDGFSFGERGEKFGEVVFNTSMAGYQEILTDPSYKGQIVVMTYPLIGNYGVNREDIESRRAFVEGFVVRESSRISSNWRAKETLDEYLKKEKIVGIQGVDTRALTKHIRLKGAMKAVISSKDLDEKKLVKKVKSSLDIVGRDLIKDVTIDKAFDWNKKGEHKIVVLDCGVKYNILRMLEERNCRVRVVPAKTSAENILREKPDGVLLSNGPGDPEAVPYVIGEVRDLVGKIPIFGICLGHQMLALAMGGKTYKLKFGHHGGNQPVKDVKTGKVSITSQNHGFCADLDSLEGRNLEVTHVNLNDETIEGMRNDELGILSIQFHPEASPGPRDARYLFDEFIQMVKQNKRK